MDKFNNELDEICHDLLLLVEKKIILKNEVTNPHLNWEKRMDIYSKIQMVNNYIDNFSSVK